MLKVGVIGYGYWGPNVVRNFSSMDCAKVVSICDRDKVSLDRAMKTYRNINCCRDYMDVTDSDTVDIVAIVTPVSTHFEIAKRALQNGKHVFVEKPFTSNSSQAEELMEIAHKNKLKIMVDHTYVFTPAVKKIKEIVEKNALGELYYYDSTRVNLGLFQHDVNVIWDLAPHDLSIMDHVLKEKPEAVIATGTKHFSGGKENIAYLTIYFRNNMIAHFNVNWLSPVKIRMTMIGGEKKMLVWNDLETDEKIKIYDKGVKVTTRDGVYNLLVEYRSGDMWAPRIEHREALRTELEYFADCILTNKKPVNGAEAGLRVVRMLEAADKSLSRRGELTRL